MGAIANEHKSKIEQREMEKSSKIWKRVERERNNKTLAERKKKEDISFFFVC